MISIVIPVFNEAKRLEKSMDIIFAFLKSFKEKVEVVVVNDGSFDKTAEILEKLKKKYPLTLVYHLKNMGKGAAIRTGIRETQGDLILFTDIDLSVPIEFLNDYLKALDHSTDIIIGTRVIKGAKVEVKQHWLREFLGEFFTIFSNLILGVGVSDFTCGFKMFKKKAAELTFGKQLINRWSFDAEVLFIAKKHHLKIKEVPVIWRHQEGSKVKFPQDLIDSFFGLLTIRLNSFNGKYD